MFNGIRNFCFVGFRERCDEYFPLFTTIFNSISGVYLNVMPESLKDRLLEVNGDKSPSNTLADQFHAKTSTTSTASNASNATK